MRHCISAANFRSMATRAPVIAFTAAAAIQSQEKPGGACVRNAMKHRLIDQDGLLSRMLP
ncbi:MAG TPA: hypothetical protein VGL08_12880 [Paraburkholderia sp.]